MTSKFERGEDITINGRLGHVIRCQGEIDIYTSPNLMKLTTESLDDPTVQILELNLERVAYIDSTGLGVMINAHKRACLEKDSSDAFRIRVGKHNPLVRKIFRTTGLIKRFLIDSERTGEFPISEPS